MHLRKLVLECSLATKAGSKNNHLTKFIYTFCLFPAPPVRLLMLDPPYKTDLIETKRILDEKPKKLIRARFEGVWHKNLFREIQHQPLQGHELSLAIFDVRSA